MDKEGIFCLKCRRLVWATMARVNGSVLYRCEVCGHEKPGSYKARKAGSACLQRVAIDKRFPARWPKYRILQPDMMPTELAKVLDVGGVDTILCSRDGHMVYLGQRFREYEVWLNARYRDFTIRQREWHRHLAALADGGVIPAYYVYGYASADKTDFAKLYVVKYREWIADAQKGQTRRPYFKDRRQGNRRGYENFYFMPWRQMPDKYIDYSYPAPTEQMRLAV